MQEDVARLPIISTQSLRSDEMSPNSKRSASVKASQLLSFMARLTKDRSLVMTITSAG